MNNRPSLKAILFGLSFMSCGNALVNIIVPLKAQLLGFATYEISWVASFYYLGYLVGCIYTPHLVKRVGHIRAFILVATVISSATLSYSQTEVSYYWMLLRTIAGFCIATIYMIAESWVNDLAGEHNRARIIGRYRVVDLSAVVIGQTLVGSVSLNTAEGLIIANIIMSLGVLPLAITTSREPSNIGETKFAVRKMFKRNRVAALSSVVFGMSWGAFSGIGPVFAKHFNLTNQMVGYFVASAIVGGILFQMLVGTVADKIDNEKIIAILAACAGACALVLWHGDLKAVEMIVLTSLWGGFATPIYSLSIAIANRLKGDSDFLEVSGSLLFIYGMGAIIGPKIAGFLVEVFEMRFLFLFIGLALLSLIVFIPILRLLEHRTRPVLAGPKYIPTPVRSPAIYEIDPRRKKNK